MKRFLIFVLTILVVNLIFTCCSCSQTLEKDDNDKNNNTEIIETEKLKLNYTTFDLTQFESFTLICENYNDVTFSSDNSNVATVDENGLVFGLNVGTANIIVKNSLNQTTCVVSVIENKVKPYIALKDSIEELTINVDESYTISPNLIFKSNNISSTFIYEFDDEYIDVDSNGKITAKKQGEVGLTIKTSFYGKEVEKVINIFVVGDGIEINVDKTSYAIFKNNSTSGVISFDLSSTVVIEDGEIIDSPQLEYDFDDTLLEKNGQIFTAINKSGVTEDNETSVSITYKTKTIVIDVDIIFPIVNKTNDLHFYVDNWKDSNKTQDKKIDKDVYSFKYNVFNNKQITSIINIVNGKDIDLKYNNQVLEIDNLVKGDYIWKICNDDYGYKVKVSVVDFVIYDKNDFDKIINVATDENIVLGEDIDYNGTFVRTTENIFGGVFDGNYHKLSNLSMGAMHGGIFFKCNNATIKNLAVINANNSAYFSKTEYRRGLFADWLTNTTLDNIYIDIYTTSGSQEGVLANKLVSGVNVNNVVINYRTTYNVQGQTSAISFTMGLGSDTFFSSVSNLCVVCSDKICLTHHGSDYIMNLEELQNVFTETDISGIYQYTTLEDLLKNVSVFNGLSDYLKNLLDNGEISGEL